jgi:hypothetical protein
LKDHRVCKIPAKTMSGYSIYFDKEQNWVFRSGSSTLSLMDIPPEPSQIEGYYLIFDNNIWSYKKKE